MDEVALALVREVVEPMHHDLLSVAPNHDHPSHYMASRLPQAPTATSSRALSQPVCSRETSAPAIPRPNLGPSFQVPHPCPFTVIALTISSLLLAHHLSQDSVVSSLSHADLQ